MSERQPELPALPYRIQLTMQAARQVKPGPALEQRLLGALDDVDRHGKPRRKRSSHRRAVPAALALVGGVAVAGGVYLVSAVRSPGVTGSFARTLDVQIPDTGHVWVDLPVDTQHHEEDKVEVSFKAPASVPLHVDEGSPEGYRRECEEHHCVHHWAMRSRTSDGVRPRVRISHPGRYELHVTHASSQKRYHERFVVRATR